MSQFINLSPAVVSTIQGFTDEVSNLEFDVDNLFFHTGSIYARTLLGDASEYFSDLGGEVNRLLPRENSHGEPHLVPLALQGCSRDLNTLGDVLAALVAKTNDTGLRLAFEALIARVRALSERAGHLAATTLDDES